jgi:hypothetical protein
VLILGCIPILFFVASVAVSFPRRSAEAGGAPLRESLLIGSVVFGMWVVIGTELLSLRHWLSPYPVLFWWTVPTVAVAAVARWGRHGRLPEGGPWAADAGARDVLGCCFVGAVAVVLLLTGTVAAVTPPNNYDAQLYHLPRQIYWIHQASVEHYPTFALRQIMMPPMAEFVGTQFLLLTGTDRWANLVQWFSLAMTAIAASLIARELGAAMRGQSLAALLVVSNPMAAMQATNTKNDLVLSLWVCATAYFALTVWTRPARPPGHAVLLGASIGLALLTKGTATPFVVPLGVAAGVAILARERQWIAAGLTISLVAVALNAGHFARNLDEFGSPVGSVRVQRLMMNETFSPAVVASNLVRNAMLHAAMPSQAVNRALRSATIRFHRWIGIHPDDRRSTLHEAHFAVSHLPFDEDRAGAPLHLMLAAAVAPLLLWKRRRDVLLVAAALAVSAAFALFCVMLKWQPFHARLHLPVVSLFAAVAGALLDRARPVAVATIALATVLVVVPHVLWGWQKPLLGSPSIFTATWQENMLRTHPYLLKPLRCTVDAARAIAPQRIGITAAPWGWEYVVQQALLRGLARAPRFVPASTHRDLRPHALETADLVVRIDDLRRHKFANEPSKAAYVAVKRCGPYTLYVPRATAGGPRGVDPG